MYAVRFSGVSVAHQGDRVHRDPGRRELQRKRPRERDDAALRGRVGGEVRERLDVGGGGDVEDPPTRALLGHAQGRGPAAVEVAVEVRGQESVPVVVGGLDDRAHEQARRVVDPDVDAAESLHGGVGEPLDVLGATRVTRQHQRLATVVADRHLGLHRLVERDARDVRP